MRFALLLLQFVLLRIRGKALGMEYGRRLRDALEQLEGLWIKFGQLLSLRSDVFSHDFCNELSRLQDQATGFPPHVARQILEAELGGPVELYFDQFNDAPVAAGSIGQVHLACLRGKKAWVAVKVQRPFIDRSIAQDLSLIRLIVRLIRKLWFVPDLRWDEMLWELDQIAAEETDYRFEASSTRRMRKNLRKHRVYVPKVFTPYCTKRVLTVEFLDGALMTDYIRLLESDPKQCAAWRTENNISPLALANGLYQSLWRQLLEDNLFHGDPHPGNIMLLRDSQVALIDFGTVGSMEKEYHQKYRLLIKAIADQDYAKSADLLFLLSGALPQRDLTEIKQALIRALRAWEKRVFTLGIPYKEKSLSRIANELIGIMFRHGCVADWSFVQITRAQETFDRSFVHLHPNPNYITLTREYFRQAERRAYRRALRVDALRHYVGMVIEALSIPGRAAENMTLQGWLIRRHLQVFQGVTSKIYRLLAIVVGRSGYALLFGMVLLVAVFLHQHYPGAVPAYITSQLGSLFRAFPRLDYAMWIILVVVTIVSYLTLRRLKRDMSHKEREREWHRE
jgi:ubiquinone biosynthesis protein